MKKTLIVVLAVALTLVLIVLSRDNIIRTGISLQMSNMLGAKVSIGGFSMSLFKQTITIKDFRIYNPKGFPRGKLLDLPLIFIDYDLKELLARKLHLHNISIELKEASVIRDKAGNLNFDALKVAKKDKEEKKEPPSMAFKIDLLRLNLDKVVFEDYSRGEKPWIEVYNLGAKDRQYKNINGAEQLVSLLLVESLRPTAIKSAAIYSVASIAGMSFLPVAAISIFTGKDSDSAELKADYDRTYAACRKVIDDLGTLVKDDKASGRMEGRLYSASVTIELKKIQHHQTQVTVTVRERLLPKPTVAAGVLFKIGKTLKR